MITVFQQFKAVSMLWGGGKTGSRKQDYVTEVQGKVKNMSTREFPGQVSSNTTVFCHSELFFSG